tara:strand:- start:1330 stop:1503 length:174 start_codon:yes stop_codon:yes gene_type:complete
MKMELYDELMALVDTFAEEELDYALCGSLAVGFHSYRRFTQDINFSFDKITSTEMLQ